MVAFSFLAVSISHICLFSGFYVLTLAPESATHRTFFGMATFAGLWNLFSAFLLSSTSLEKVLFWARMATQFEILFVGLVIPFTLALTRSRSQWAGPALTAAPSIGLSWACWTGRFVFAEIFFLEGNLHFHTPSGSPWLWTWIVYSQVVVVLSLIVLFVWTRKAASRCERLRGVVVSVSLLVYAASAYAGELLASVRHSIGSISPYLFVLFLVGTAYGMARYRLFSVTRRALGKDIVESLDMMVVMTGPDLRIVTGNHAAERLVGRPRRDLMTCSITDVVSAGPNLVDGLTRVLTHELTGFSCIAGFPLNPENTQAELHVSRVQGHNGDTLGLLLVGEEIHSPEGFLAKYQITNREWETILHVATGATNSEIARNLNITERTVKAHLGHIYEKLQVPSRTALLVTLRELRVISGARDTT